MCKLCDSKRISIDVRTEDPSDRWYFSTDPVVGMIYCPLCGGKYGEKLKEAGSEGGQSAMMPGE